MIDADEAEIFHAKFADEKNITFSKVPNFGKV
jgi:hypothetical protein